MAAEVVGRVSTWRWKSPAGAMDNVDVVVTRESVSVCGMKRIFRVWGVNRSMVRLDLLAVRGLFVFLEVSHGGLKLSHERLQRPEIWAGARPMSLYIEPSLTSMKALLDQTCFLQSIKGYLI